MKEMYIVSSVFLSSLNISDLNTLIRFHVFEVISAIWSCHVQVLFNVKPRCLCEVTFSIRILFIYSGGWLGGLTFLVINNSSVLFGLNETNHFVTMFVFSLSHCSSGLLMPLGHPQ